MRRSREAATITPIANRDSAEKPTARAAVQLEGTHPFAGMMDRVQSVGMLKDIFTALEKSRSPSDAAMTSLLPSCGLTAQSS